MTRRKGLVLGANILLRAVFGVRVRALLEIYKEVSFYSPDVYFDDARKYIPEIAYGVASSRQAQAEAWRVNPSRITMPRFFRGRNPL